MTNKEEKEETKKPDRSDYFLARPEDFVFHKKGEN